MKWCVEIKQSTQSYRAWWHVQEYDTREEAEALLAKHKASDREYKQVGQWNYRIVQVQEEE